MRNVESSNLAAYHWEGFDDVSGDGTLLVKFKNGRVYRYEGVPREVSEDLDTLADEGGSVGSFFSREIRSGGYETSEARSPDETPECPEIFG